MYRPRNEQCPRRSIGLTHVADGSVNCSFCGVLTMVTTPVNVKELREKVIEELKPTDSQRRWWDFLHYAYRRKVAIEERSNVVPIGPADQQWLDEALARLDEFDG
jgi:hypothetical protein